VALFSWFAHQTPSIGLKGRYSYRGSKFFAPASSCRDLPLPEPGGQAKP
jgi:hypothetical protein